MIKQTHKIITLLTFFACASASLFAGDLEVAVLKFGGGSNLSKAAAAILAKQGQLQGTNAFSIANALKTNAGYSLGRFLAKDKKSLFAKGTMSDSAVAAALQDLVETRMAPVEPSAPIMKEEIQASGIMDPNGNAVSQEQFDKVLEELARLVQVTESQKIVDAAVAAQGNEMLQSVIAKSQDMGEACLGIVDVMFEHVRQAIAAMDDMEIANKVIARVKQNASSLSAVSTRSKANTLGRMSSKKNKKARV
jgi:hypothetical protein